MWQWTQFRLHSWRKMAIRLPGPSTVLKGRMRLMRPWKGSGGDRLLWDNYLEVSLGCLRAFKGLKLQNDAPRNRHTTITFKLKGR